MNEELKRLATKRAETDALVRELLAECERLVYRFNAEAKRGDKLFARIASPSIPEGYADNESAWEAVAHHLRHCRECGELDVTNCAEGSALWLAAAKVQQP